MHQQIRSGQEGIDGHGSTDSEGVLKVPVEDKYKTKEELLPYFNKIIKNNTTYENREAYEYAVCLKEGKQLE